MSMKDELKDDLSFNDVNLADKMQSLPGIISKWSDRLVKCKYALNKLENSRAIMARIRTDYYTGRKADKQTGKMCPAEITAQQVKDVYVPADPEIINIKEQIDKKQLELNFYENALKQCNQIQWVHKNFIDWNKYINGAV